MLYFLVGFMGSGKSHMGRRLAKQLDIPWVDMDKEIERAEGRTINDIFAESGEDYFRQLERDYLLQLDKDQDLIVATGGGAPCFYDNMKTMNEKGRTLYLNRKKEVVIAQLMKGLHRRPLLKGKTQEQVMEYYDAVMKERRPYYEQATIFVEELNYLDIAQMISSGWL